MRCKVSKRPLPAIWKHPDLDGQVLAAYTRDWKREMNKGQMSDRELKNFAVQIFNLEK